MVHVDGGKGAAEPCPGDQCVDSVAEGQDVQRDRVQGQQDHLPKIRVAVLHCRDRQRRQRAGDAGPDPTVRGDDGQGVRERL